MNAKSILAFGLAAVSIVHADISKKMLHPDYPIVEGQYQMTDNWSITLDQKHNRRIEDGSLVIWRPGFTVWILVWNLKDGETPEDRFKSLREDVSDEAADIEESKQQLPLRLSYRLAEDSEDEREAAFYGFAVGPSGHCQVAIYFDAPEDLAKAKAIFASLTPTNPKSEQDAAMKGQPATRPEPKSEGSDKPQPEAEGHPR